MEFDSGILIILRGINLNKNAEPEDMVSIRMWIDSERIITMQRRNLKAVFDVKDSIEAGKIIKSSGEFLYNLLYQVLFVTSSFLYGLSEELDEIEKKIITTHDIKFREKVLQIRTQTATFKRYLIPQKEAIQRAFKKVHLW